MARRQAPGTKQRILVVAARLFGRHGVRSVGMQQLVDETLLKHTRAAALAEHRLRRCPGQSAGTLLDWNGTSSTS